MTGIKSCISGPFVGPSSTRHSQHQTPGQSAMGLLLGLVVGVGCTQDYDINALEGDDAPAVAPALTPATPSNGVATAPSVVDANAVADSEAVDPSIGSGTAVADGSVTDPASAGAADVRFDPRQFNYDAVQPTGDAVEASEDPTHREREELFDLNPEMRTSVVDFLFVVDNSTSMGRIRDLVRSGLVSLYDDDPFPADARIAVMSTIPANPSDLSQLHPRVNNQGAQELEPGFLRLVDAQGIARFRRAAPDLGASFRFDGCEDAWFEPWEENDEGVPCLVAHTQISGTPVRVEAGLSALQQFLQKQAGESTFRDGAAVHVIFVSDTHSPGLSGGLGRLQKTGLEVDPITYGDLQQLVDADNAVSSFKVHAIAPATECVEEWAHLGPRYFDVAEASGGATLDICTAEDYAPFIRSLVERSGVIDTPILSLGRPTEAVHQVLLDGQSVAFDIIGDGTAVRVKGFERAAADRKLTVRYRY